MRTSRLSQETTRLFNGPVVTSSDYTITRRVTRSALAQFSYTRNDAAPTPPLTESLLGRNTPTADIEDAVPEVPQSTPRSTRSARKRKRSPDASPTKIKVEVEMTETIDTLEDIKVAPKNSPRRIRKAARVIKDEETGESVVEPPSDWEETYRIMREMRLYGVAQNAAVDTMGCERLAVEESTPLEKRFHTLIALMLSSQTKDTVNFAAMQRLKTELPPYEPGAKPGLTIQNIIAVEPEVLNELIGKVGFHNNKTKFIKQAALLLRDKFNSDIPTTIEDMISLPGVGPKMAYLCMSAPNGWNRIEGIGVDVHVHRITNLWGWQKPESKTPEETRLALQSWLPRDKWRDINWLLVGLGQTVCLPIGRKCGQCDLGLQGLCKAAERKKVIEGRRIKTEMLKLEVEVKMEAQDVVSATVVDSSVQVKEEEVVESRNVIVPRDEQFLDR